MVPNVQQRPAVFIAFMVTSAMLIGCCGADKLSNYVCLKDHGTFNGYTQKGDAIYWSKESMNAVGSGGDQKVLLISPADGGSSFNYMVAFPKDQPCSDADFEIKGICKPQGTHEENSGFPFMPKCGQNCMSLTYTCTVGLRTVDEISDARIVELRPQSKVHCDWEIAIKDARILVADRSAHDTVPCYLGVGVPWWVWLLIIFAVMFVCFTVGALAFVLLRKRRRKMTSSPARRHAAPSQSFWQRAMQNLVILGAHRRKTGGGTSAQEAAAEDGAASQPHKNGLFGGSGVAGSDYAASCGRTGTGRGGGTADHGTSKPAMTSHGLTGGMKTNDNNNNAFKPTSRGWEPSSAATGVTVPSSRGSVAPATTGPRTNASKPASRGSAAPATTGATTNASKPTSHGSGTTGAMTNASKPTSHGSGTTGAMTNASKPTSHGSGTTGATTNASKPTSRGSGTTGATANASKPTSRGSGTTGATANASKPTSRGSGTTGATANASKPTSRGSGTTGAAPKSSGSGAAKGGGIFSSYFG